MWRGHNLQLRRPSSTAPKARDLPRRKCISCATLRQLRRRSFARKQGERTGQSCVLLSSGSSQCAAMRSLSRALRLATVLSATPSSSSSPLARYESSTAVDMSATLARAAAATATSPRVAALSRARLVRRRPGFVGSTSISTSTTARLAAHSSSQHASSSSPLATKPEVGRRHGLYSLHREASHPVSRGTSASLEKWFAPNRRSLERSLRLYSADAAALGSSSATVDGDYISSLEVQAHSTGGGTETALREDAGELEAEEGEGGEGEDGAAPFKVSGWCHV